MRLHPKLVDFLLPTTATVLFFALWEAVVRVFQVPSFLLPAPSEIFSVTLSARDAILTNSWQTLFTTLIGFAAAVAFGLVGGVILGSSSLIYKAFYPLLIGVNSVPKVAIVPILVIWFGIGTVPAIISAFLISFFPIMVNVATGIATVEPELKDVLRALGASRYDVVVKIGIPRSMPYFFASLKVALTLAFVGTIISETIAANRGIGFLIMSAAARFKVPLVFSGLLVTAIMGVAMYLIAAFIEQRTLHWAMRKPQ